MDSIRKDNVQKNLLKNLSSSTGADLVKSITQEQFEDKYGSGYQVYERKGIRQYLKDSISKSESSEEIEVIKQNVKELKSVFVKSKSTGNIKEFLVQKSLDVEEFDINLEEEADNSLGKSRSLEREIEDELEKGKKMPIGTISNGRKKVAEGKWVDVKKTSSKKAEQFKEDKKYTKKVEAWLQENYDWKPSFVDRMTNGYRVKIGPKDQKLAEKLSSLFSGVVAKKMGSPSTWGVIIPFKEPNEESKESEKSEKPDLQKAFHELGILSEDEIQKAKAAPIGTINKYNEIKTASGWKYIKKNKKGELSSEEKASQAGISHDEYKKLHPKTKAELDKVSKPGKKPVDNIKTTRETVKGLKIGESITVKETGLSSLSKIAGKQGKIVGFKDTGLTSQPKFLVVEIDGEKKELNPSFVTANTSAKKLTDSKKTQYTFKDYDGNVLTVTDEVVVNGNVVAKTKDSFGNWHIMAYKGSNRSGYNTHGLPLDFNQTAGYGKNENDKFLLKKYDQVVKTFKDTPDTKTHIAINGSN